MRRALLYEFYLPRNMRRAVPQVAEAGLVWDWLEMDRPARAEWGIKLD